jgi:hypothetical protein
MEYKVVPFLVGIGVMILVGCGRTPKDRERQVLEPAEEGAVPASEPGPTVSKPIVNVYMENSASMDGYVTGNTDFKIAVYSYLSDIKILDVTDSLNLYYINSEVIPYEDDISDFFESLNPDSFRIRGGNRGATDVSGLLRTILERTHNDTLSILVSDFIFSPGKGKDAGEYLEKQQIEIKSTIAEILKKHDDLGMMIYQLSSQFDGIYYDREDNERRIHNRRRPFYIWIMGDKEYIDTLYVKVPASKIRGSGVENSFYLTQSSQIVGYVIPLSSGTGTFDLDEKYTKTNLVNAKTNDDGVFSFVCNVNFSGLPLDNEYLKHIENYILSDAAYQLQSIDTLTSDRYSHALNLHMKADSTLSAGKKVKPAHLSIKLKMAVPEWVKEMNDDEGLDINADGAMDKTYGIKYLVEGVYDAFTQYGDFYSEIKVSIND